MVVHYELWLHNNLPQSVHNVIDFSYNNLFHYVKKLHLKCIITLWAQNCIIFCENCYIMNILLQ